MRTITKHSLNVPLKQKQSRPHTVVQQSCVSVVDYRNCKYQGPIQKSTCKWQKVPHGFGVLVDQNYTWLATNWNQGNINEESQGVAVFADSHKMYGSLHQNVLIQQQNSKNKLKVYEKDDTKIYQCGNIFVLQLKQSSKSGCNSLSKFQAFTEKDRDQICVTLTLVSHQQIQRKGSDEKYMQIFRNLLQIQNIAESDISFDQYIKKYPKLLTNIPLSPRQTPKNPQNSNVSTSSAAGQNKSTIVCHRSDKAVLTLQFNNKFTTKISKIGCRNVGQRSDEICRIIRYYQDGQGGVVEQRVNGEVNGYVEYQIQQHKQSNQYNSKLYGRSNKQIRNSCRKNLRECYRRSFNFCNKFLNLKPVYKQRNHFIRIFKSALTVLQAEHINALKSSQSLSSYLVHLKQPNYEPKQQNSLRKDYEASIVDIKRQIQKVEQQGRNLASSKKASRISRPVYVPALALRHRNSSSFSFKTSQQIYQQSLQTISKYQQQYNISGCTNLQNYRYSNNSPKNHGRTKKYSSPSRQFQQIQINEPNIQRSSPSRISLNPYQKQNNYILVQHNSNGQLRRSSRVQYTNDSEQQIAPYRYNKLATSSKNIKQPLFQVSSSQFNKSSARKQDRVFNEPQMQSLMKDYQNIYEQIKEYQRSVSKTPGKSKSNKKGNKNNNSNKSKSKTKSKRLNQSSISASASAKKIAFQHNSRQNEQSSNKNRGDTSPFDEPRHDHQLYSQARLQQSNLSQHSQISSSYAYSNNNSNQHRITFADYSDSRPMTSKITAAYQKLQGDRSYVKHNNQNKYRVR